MTTTDTTNQIAKDLILETMKESWGSLGEQTRGEILLTVTAALRMGKLAGIDHAIKALRNYDEAGPELAAELNA